MIKLSDVLLDEWREEVLLIGKSDWYSPDSLAKLMRRAGAQTTFKWSGDIYSVAGALVKIGMAEKKGSRSRYNPTRYRLKEKFVW